ncbi:competence protein CoiA family protein [Vibrio breoganii]|uniref:competence protein CoiA family protein n=1 Tax=Vibrio breoganii TaxID=553239 RepID=UPI000C850465|nr:competence protein CoiA family protein [Vibrio breoganii]PMP03373.1 hypothetical protein BCS94_17585 [Vibrio breoganii]
MTAHSGLMMTRAFDDTGRLVAIDNVANGKACNCTCVTCGSSLIAKQRGSRASHFAHEAGAECNWSGETELHLIAKEVIEQDRFVEFHYVTFDGNRKDIKVPFNSLKKEASFAGYRPDILAYTEHNEPLVVEICVHHACEDEKIQHLNSERVNAVEIHLALDDFKAVPVLTVENVREGIERAYKRLISINPLSEFARDLISINADVLSAQSSKIKELGVNISELKRSKKDLQDTINVLKAEHLNIASRAEAYRRKTYQDMHQDPEFKNYDLKRKSLDKKHKYRTNELKKEYLKAKTKYLDEHNEECQRLDTIRDQKAEKIRQLNTGLAKDNTNNQSGGINWSVERKATLNKEIAQLDEIRNDMYLHGCEGRVQDYIEKIKEQYANKFDELEKCWQVVSTLKPKMEKPNFISEPNSTLGNVVPLKSYGDHRG